MKANPGTCYLLLNTQQEANIQIANTTIESSRSQELLGIVIDSKLKFCQKTNRKLNVLTRLTNYMELPKRCILVNGLLKLNLIITLLF